MKTTRQRILELEDKLGALEDLGINDTQEYLQLEAELHDLEAKKIEEDREELFELEEPKIDFTQHQRIIKEYE